MESGNAPLDECCICQEEYIKENMENYYVFFGTLKVQGLGFRMIALDNDSLLRP